MPTLLWFLLYVSINECLADFQTLNPKKDGVPSRPSIPAVAWIFRVSSPNPDLSDLLLITESLTCVKGNTRNIEISIQVLDHDRLGDQCPGV